MRPSTQPRRGDVWRVAFGRPLGHEQGAGTRPGLILSTDEFNESGALAIVAPITRTARDYPTRVRLRTDSSGLDKPSWAAVEHLRSISVLRLEQYLGTVGPAVLKEVEGILDLLLFDRG